jgi:hypothetical protein
MRILLIVPAAFAISATPVAAQRSPDVSVGTRVAAAADGASIMRAVGLYLRSSIEGPITVDPIIDCRTQGECVEWKRTVHNVSSPPPHALAAVAARATGATTATLRSVVRCPAGPKTCQTVDGTTYVRVSTPIAAGSGASVHVVILPAAVPSRGQPEMRLERLYLTISAKGEWRVVSTTSGL